MLTDALQIELLKNSPTFRRQTSAGVLAVGLERWKAVSATLAILKKAMADWTWTVPDWLEQQSLAQHYINGQILGLLSDLAAAPTLNLG